MSYTVVLAYMPGLRYEFHSTDEYRESLPQGEEDRHPCKYVETDLSASLCGLLDEFCNRLGEGGHSFLVTRFAMKAVATVIPFPLNLFKGHKRGKEIAFLIGKMFVRFSHLHQMRRMTGRREQFKKIAYDGFIYFISHSDIGIKVNSSGFRPLVEGFRLTVIFQLILFNDGGLICRIDLREGELDFFTCGVLSSTG